MTTLFRVGLEVSTTRLVLADADAGSVVHAFGSSVVAGNLVVGLVVFAVITIVQLIVVARGAERVAEVAARFALDAMPGKQMAIDAELRAGAIDAETARRRRGDLERESQLYGAMDGAMRFVKGDAIAAIVIVVINLDRRPRHRRRQPRHDAPREAVKTYSLLVDRRRPRRADPVAARRGRVGHARDARRLDRRCRARRGPRRASCRRACSPASRSC